MSPGTRDLALVHLCDITRLTRILYDTHARRIFIELSDEYKTMDPATPDVGKRRILASHLKESVDVLELKVS